MMMTGRALLVCALCVLWCGAAVEAEGDGSGVGSGDADGNMVLIWYIDANETCKKKNTQGEKLDKSAFKSCVNAAMKEICYDYYNETPSESRDFESDEICNNYIGDSEETIDTSTPLTEPSHDAEKPVATPTPETSKVEAAEMGSPPGVPAGDSPANPTEGPQSTLAANDTANSEAEKDGKEVMPKNAPESNASRKEEGEKKHSNTKEKPLEAEAKKNITMTADSDGSTAVSHTTSPLLLLVVAYAATAAVVAA
ncbi:mucin-associated surface protein (MASP), putative [Trypanosoma cruzi]|uniref:Mucin-associated surface protein (MASP), putative n=1 Tax=Trypanosoma cruzi (strain CL Brener) TaxID=353153 RepID=Q4DAW9_TRYCC|nr:mucin-associated surface protein (MASP), putative [Trypanosoma cruzi]EAN89674.1 mucin-associated surface protein (MASP), putative [Trypanosoma cruzi]|eukprot:XP_811525.1 mucin-associated surface protein (MASP) [Trypanosoma cruzi strain CL Brener]